ncbi:SHOCT domain-containing protein [Halorubrum halophilum]|uniref:SHOCT domain-containing protein n=1 Tax=Halorubrum halophilum TaxID=413816 RepID=UPI000678EF5D|nr:SHOCT domain-containing protein [Halorubrum halophilum]
MALPTFGKMRLAGIISVLSFGLTALFAVLLPGFLEALIPATFIRGFFVLVPLVLLMGDDFPLVASEGSNGASADEPVSVADDPLATLRERYATGEIGEEEFERKLDRLLETEELADRVDAGDANRRESPDRRERETELE